MVRDAGRSSAAPKVKSITLEVHPLAALFPLIPTGEYGAMCKGEGGEFGLLCLDIQKHGLIHPIVLHEEKILDGRNRLRACQHVGVEPKYVEFASLNLKCAPEEYIWSQNMSRRHMTVDQRAAIAQLWHAKLANAAKERSLANLQRGRTKPTPISDQAKTPDRETDREAKSLTPTRSKLAKMAKASEHKTRMACEIGRKRPELLDKVAQGEITLVDAKKEISAPSESRAFEVWREVRRITGLIERTLDNKSFAEIKTFVIGLIREMNGTFAEIKDRKPTDRWHKKSPASSKSFRKPVIRDGVMVIVEKSKKAKSA